MSFFFASIFLNFGLARDYDGACHLRFDDTNPVKEEQEFVDAIIEDVEIRRLKKKSLELAGIME